MLHFWAKVKSNIFHVRLLWLLLGKIGLLFNLTSGHSTHDSERVWAFTEVG